VAADPPSGRFPVPEGVAAAPLGCRLTPIVSNPPEERIMSNKLFKYLAPAALALACLGATIGETNAGSFRRGCAARDLQILMLIEDREDANAVSKERVINAIQTMFHARIVCHQGRVVDALKIYDTIDQIFTSDPFTSTHVN
jgi:hypothetical protein